MSTEAARAALSVAIAAREAAEGVAAEASQAVERAAGMHRAATNTLKGFDGLDARIGQHHARSIRAGETIGLTPDIATDRDARDAARNEVAGLEAGLRHLAGEHKEAMAALVAARSAVDQAADGIIAAEAAELAEQVDRAEAATRALRDRLEALIVACQIRVSERVREVNGRRVMSNWEAMQRPVYRAGDAPIEQSAYAYRERLRSDANAQMGI